VPFNPDSSDDLLRLETAFERSWRDLEPFREDRKEFVKQWAGSHYGINGADERVGVNLIDFLVTVYLVNIAANNPRVSITPVINPRELQFEARRLEKATDQVMIETDLHSKIQMWVLDALFTVGISYTGIKYAGMIDLEDGGEPVAITSTFTSRIDLDDFVMDTCAKRWREAGFYAHRERVPLEDVVGNEMYDEEARKAAPSFTNRDYSTGREDRVEDISYDDRSGDEYQDMVEVWSYYFPRERIIMKMVADHWKRPLIWYPFEGPIEGPYDLLSFNDVPDNIMPRSPVAGVYDLHDLYNEIFRKTADQALRQKKVPLMDGANPEDAAKVTNAADGQAVGVRNLSAYKEAMMGGAAPENLVMMGQLHELFNQQGGNLPLLGGIQAQSDTLGQDDILNRNANNRMAHYQGRMVTFLEKVIRKMMWYEWTDPIRERTLGMSGPGGTTISIPWNHETRKGDFIDFNFRVDPYSMQHRSPSEKLRLIQDLLMNMILPNQQMMQQQGIELNWAELFKQVAKLSAVPEIEQLLIYSAGTAPKEEEVTGETPQTSGPPHTSREYVRKSVPSANRANQQNELMQSLLTGAIKNNQQAAAGSQASM
jgi:hypothetical protein